jgi:hypothetical protein
MPFRWLGAVLGCIQPRTLFMWMWAGSAAGTEFRRQHFCFSVWGGHGPRLDEGCDLRLQIARRVIVFQQDAVLKRLVPALDPTLVWGDRMSMSLFSSLGAIKG